MFMSMPRRRSAPDRNLDASATPVRCARHAVLWWMQCTRYRGIAMPWAIYVHPLHEGDARLVAHERVHIEQMRRDGVGRFFVRYLWWSMRYGYRMNPYEMQARAEEEERGG